MKLTEKGWRKLRKILNEPTPDNSVDASTKSVRRSRQKPSVECKCHCHPQNQACIKTTCNMPRYNPCIHCQILRVPIKGKKYCQPDMPTSCKHSSLGACNDCLAYTNKKELFTYNKDYLQEGDTVKIGNEVVAIPKVTPPQTDKTTWEDKLENFWFTHEKILPTRLGVHFEDWKQFIAELLKEEREEQMDFDHKLYETVDFNARREAREEQKLLVKPLTSRLKPTRLIQAQALDVYRGKLRGKIEERLDEAIYNNMKISEIRDDILALLEIEREKV